MNVDALKKLGIITHTQPIGRVVYRLEKSNVEITSHQWSVEQLKAIVAHMEEIAKIKERYDSFPVNIERSVSQIMNNWDRSVMSGRYIWLGEMLRLLLCDYRPLCTPELCERLHRFVRYKIDMFEASNSLKDDIARGEFNGINRGVYGQLNYISLILFQEARVYTGSLTYLESTEDIENRMAEVLAATRAILYSWYTLHESNEFKINLLNHFIYSCSERQVNIAQDNPFVQLINRELGKFENGSTDPLYLKLLEVLKVINPNGEKQ